MATRMPKQLKAVITRLPEPDIVRVCRPACRSHSDCEKPGKRPVTDSRDIEQPSDAAEWIAEGGNVGVSCLRDLVVVDSDSLKFEEIAARVLLSTFTVSSPGGRWNHHRYIECPDWDRNKPISNNAGKEVGSIRSNGWIAVAPPSKHPNGGRYEIEHNKEVAKVKPSTPEKVVEIAGGNSSDDDTKSAERPRQRRTSNGLDDLDKLIDHDDRRAEIRAVLRDSDPSHDRRAWLAGFLHEAVGLSTSEVVDLIDRHNRWSDYDRMITRKQVRSVVR